MPSHPIYMDNHATTPLDPRVLAAMRPYLEAEFGNPASKTHGFGWRAEEAVAKARSTIAASLGCRSDEVIFTSGATESNNLALKGLVSGHPGRAIVTSQVEHNSILDTCRFLESQGHSVAYLAPKNAGCICLNALENALSQGPFLVTFMMVNNEIGTMHCLNTIGKMAKFFGIIFHCDAAQGLGRVSVNLSSMAVDLLSISGHKIYGPKGVGALIIRKEIQTKITPQMHGGGHEFGLRSGSLNVPGIVGLAKAVALLGDVSAESAKIRTLREKLWLNLSGSLDDLQLNGDPEHRVSGNLNIHFKGVDSERLLLKLSNCVALSASSACSSGHGRPSHVLSAMGYDSARIASSIRFGLGRFNTEAEVDEVSDKVISAVKSLRKHRLLTL